MAEQKPQSTSENKAGKKAAKKPGFVMPKLSEKQWAMIAGGLFFLGYIIYTVLSTMPDTSSGTQIGLGAKMEAKTAETEEERFKRENKNASLPDGSAVSQKDIAEKTKLTQQVPFGDHELEFRVRLPNTWVMSEFARYGLPGEENYSVLTNIARYFGPAVEDARPYLWVEVERIKRYTTAETWARAYMIKRGIAPSAFVVKNETQAQALYVEVRDDYRSYAVRSLFHIEGDTMVLVSYGVPVSSYKENKDMMGLSLNSFQIVNPIHRQIEEIKEQKLLNVMQFNYYASWVPKNPFDESTLRPSIELHNPQQYNNPKGDLLQGLILINTWRKSSQFPEEANFKEVKDRLQELRMTLKEPMSKPENLPLRDSYVRIERTPYLAQVKTYIRKDQFDIVKSDESRTFQEVWITILDNNYYEAFLTLITPVKATNYVVWAQNMAAYDLLTKSLALREEPKD